MQRIKAAFSQDFIKQVKLAILVSEQHSHLAESCIQNITQRLRTLGQPEHHLQIIYSPDHDSLPLLCRAIAFQHEVDGLMIVGVSHDDQTNAQLPLQTIKEACEAITLNENLPLNLLLFHAHDETAMTQLVTDKGTELCHEATDRILAVASILNQL